MKCRVCNKEKLKVVYNEEEMSDKDLKWFKEGEEVGRASVIKEVDNWFEGHSEKEAWEWRLFRDKVLVKKSTLEKTK